jgi:hypothetical protein
MKKLLLVFSTILIIHTTSAQKLITFGPLAGYTASVLENSDYPNSTPGSGYVFGGFIRADIKKWYIQPNIYYMYNSSSIDVNQTSTDVKSKSVNGDLLLGYRFFKFTDLTYLRLFAGPGYSNINTLKYDSGTSDYSTDNILLNAGVGLDFWKLTFDLKYQRGLTDIDKSSNTMHTSLFMLTAGFKIL